MSIRMVLGISASAPSEAAAKGPVLQHQERKTGRSYVAWQIAVSAWGTAQPVRGCCRRNTGVLSGCAVGAQDSTAQRTHAPGAHSLLAGLMVGGLRVQHSPGGADSTRLDHPAPGLREHDGARQRGRRGHHTGGVLRVQSDRWQGVVRVGNQSIPRDKPDMAAHHCTQGVTGCVWYYCCLLHRLPLVSEPRLCSLIIHIHHSLGAVPAQNGHTQNCCPRHISDTAETLRSDSAHPPLAGPRLQHLACLLHDRHGG